ncbi:phosphotriesterase [Paenibacillus sp. NPDC058071]|uniref:phosphotriesterase family protein n=1 Tax=Paenibacillus sp. NPDC058071 TaxID=3346326 RepID=UPI0036D768FF
MMTIQTVRGPIDKTQFGFCHSHEHLFLAEGHPSTLNPALHMDEYDKTLAELRMLHDCGGRAVVDAQPLGSGRMEEWLLKVSSESDVHVVASTGFHKLSFYREDHWIHRFDEERLEQIFVHELTQGMYTGTDKGEPSAHIGAKAGIIKTAMDEDRMNDPDKRWFNAAAAAARRTGAPIMCHIESYEQADELVDMYMSRGILAEQIIICHLERSLDKPQNHRKLAELGIYLEYDTIGRFKYHSDEGEAELIRQMMDWGLGNQLLLGLDTTRQRMKHYGGSIGLDYLSQQFLPLLKQYGVTAEQIDRMMIHNPAEAFSFKPPFSSRV